MTPRLEEEVALLREYYPEIEVLEGSGNVWFRLKTFPLPLGWTIAGKPSRWSEVAFKIGPAHPTAEPYAFCVPAELHFDGKAPDNSSATVEPPFHGQWQQLSWAPDGDWIPLSTVREGSNLLNWVRSFTARLEQGV